MNCISRQAAVPVSMCQYSYHWLSCCCCSCPRSRQCLRFRVEDISTRTLCNGHAEIDIQANPGDAHARIVLVLARQVRVVAMVVVMSGVRMASMSTLLDGGGGGGGRRHCCRCRCWAGGSGAGAYGVHDVRPLVGAACLGRSVVESRGRGRGQNTALTRQREDASF